MITGSSHQWLNIPQLQWCSEKSEAVGLVHFELEK
jgi:hypothetical protein